MLDNFQKHKIALWLLYAFIFSAMALAVFFYLKEARPVPEARFEPHTAIIMQGNSLLAISPVEYPHKMVYGSLISCLEGKESTSGENLYGDYGYDCDNVLFESPYCSFGPLQFWQTTYKQYCIDKYGLGKDIFDAKDQRVCTDKMLEEGLIFKWTTAKLCF